MSDGYVICDLDGCLSDDRWRRPLLPPTRAPEAAYEPYHSQSPKDLLVSEVLNDILYDAYDEHGNQRSLILFVTARPAMFHSITETWINSALDAVTQYELLMRPNGNNLPSPGLKMALINDFFEREYTNPVLGWQRVVSAYDDSEGILDAYPISAKKKFLRALAEQSENKPQCNTPDILNAMAATFTERNAVYGDNYMRVAPIIKVLWPDGVPSGLVTEDRWHLFELLVVKVTRFAASGLKHVDSVHDAAVYAAMIESDLRRNA